MTIFTESNTVEQMTVGAFPRRGGAEPLALREDSLVYGKSLGGEFRPARWDDAFAARPDGADEVIYQLCAILLSVQTEVMP